MEGPRQVVDEQDRLIGYKDKSELQHPHDIYRVSALWLTNAKGEVLLAQRALTLKNGPGQWGPAVAGTVDEGETYDSNIYKEAAEELGLAGMQFTLGPKTRQHRPRNYFCQWFMATADLALHELRPDPREVAGVRWVAMDELIDDLRRNPDAYVPGFINAVRQLRDWPAAT